jgi:hypothetical protein
VPRHKCRKRTSALVVCDINFNWPAVYPGNLQWQQLRVDMMATDSRRDWKTGKILSALGYSMKCKPTVTINKPASEYAE